MSSRPKPPPKSSNAASDLDSTAELPVLDVATPAASATTTTVNVPAAATEEQQATTDTWALSAAGRAAMSAAAAANAEQLRKQELDLQARTAALQEAQERLTSHATRLLQLERARDEALASQAAAAQRAASAEQRVTAAEQRATAAEQRATAAEQQAASAEQRVTAAEQRATAAEQQATSIEQRLADLEQRAAGASEELAQARALVSTSGARTQALQQRLAQQDSDLRAQRARELEQQQALAVAGRAHAAGVMEDLHSERARAMTYLESLQTLERRREIAQHLVSDLHHEAEVRALELVRVTRELAARDERVRSQDEELTERASRLAQLEQHVSTLTTMVTQRDEQLLHQQQESQGLRASVTRLQAEINADTARLRALEAQSAQRDSDDAQRHEELQRLRSDMAGANTALEAARRATLAATTQASSQQTALAQHSERAAQLEAWLAAERQRAAQLEGELATVRSEMEEWGSVLRSAQKERGGHLATIAAAESRVRELEQAAAAREEHVRELETNLHAAEEAVRRLEADTRNRGARRTELERSDPEGRDIAGEARVAATDTNPALRVPGRQAEEEASAEQVPDGATRLLIHSDDGREIVHVLGRKTSIGRTPDNDLQLDAKYISRHHAVILVGPANAVIEDLNSTNGVQVNGRRITRQTLRDGDHIAIGRVHYRFAVRKAADKR